jgi:hypothetical protein
VATPEYFSRLYFDIDYFYSDYFDIDTGATLTTSTHFADQYFARTHFYPLMPNGGPIRFAEIVLDNVWTLPSYTNARLKPRPFRFIRNKVYY